MDNIKAPAGAVKKKRIIGRGNGSTRGGTSGRGSNGQNARSGGGVRLGFEGGQMPLYRRVARKGFSNYPFKIEYKTVNLRELENKFKDGETVNVETLKERGFLKGKNKRVKILGEGDITRKLTVDVDKVSASAQAKIEAAGGQIVKEG